MAAESGAEGAVADSLGGVRAKRWNITLKEGFQSWQMRVNAYIASKPQYQSVVGVSQMVTVAEYIGYDPSFAAVSPATQAQVLREANANIVTNLNAIYVYVLNSIDMSDDSSWRMVNRRRCPISWRVMCRNTRLCDAGAMSKLCWLMRRWPPSIGCLLFVTLFYFVSFPTIGKMPMARHAVDRRDFVLR